MLFIIGLPVVQIILFCLSIGHDPTGLKIAIVNNELYNSTEPCIPDESMLSCWFLDHLKARDVVYLPYDTAEEAYYAVEKGWAWAAISFSSNYTESLLTRITDGGAADNMTIEESDMQVVMDMSSEFQPVLSIFFSVNFKSHF